MKIIYKKLGQTPLQSLEEFRFNNPNYSKEKLSYIGRLDPMAQGEMIVLIGKEENQNRQKFLNLDKEYIAEFLIGFQTDTGDLLGLVNSFDISEIRELSSKIEQIPNLLLKIKKQKYPWFSSKHVLGRALFDWFKKGQTNQIERPIREINIYNAEIISKQEITISNLQKEIENKIATVSGDFRQKEILERWQKTLIKEDYDKSGIHFGASPERSCNIKLPILTLKIKCSTGTYIRALTENLSVFLEKPVVLFSLKREKIFII
jgi:tRNA pseudouridine(55) synthase